MWGRGITPGVRAWVTGGASHLFGASAIALAAAPVTTAAAAQLCPCPAIPEVPWSPLLVIAGVGATAGLGVRRGRRRQSDDSRRPLAGVVVRIAMLALTLAFMVLVSLAYNASATELCPCGPAGPPPAPTPTITPGVGGSGGSGSGGVNTGGGYYTGGGGSGVSGLFGLGVPSVGVSVLSEPGQLIIFGGALLVSAGCVLRRRRQPRDGISRL
jgi:hypothetical protein